MRFRFVLTLTAFCSLFSAGASEFRQEIKVPNEWLMTVAESPDRLPSDSVKWGKIWYASWWPGSTQFAKGTAFDKHKNHSLWVMKKLSVPENWNGKRILFDFPHLRGDGILFVNGQRAGSVYEPAGEIDVTSFVRPGEENSFLFFSTRNKNGMERAALSPFTEAMRIVRGYEHDKSRWEWGIPSAPILKAVPLEYVTDVYVKTSWRKKEISFEVEIFSPGAEKRLLELSVRDAQGKTVKTFRKEVQCRKGLSLFEFGGAWRDPVPWELNGPYLYTASAELKESGGKTIDQYPEFRFGFREVWREGRHAFLNGHPMHLRISYNFVAEGKGFSFFRLMGYNATIQPHCVDQLANVKKESLDYYDSTGTAVILPLPSVAYIRSRLLNDPAVSKEYDRLCTIQARRYRNHPSVIVWYTAVNSFCPKENINPVDLAKNRNNKAIQADVINRSIEIARPHVFGTLCFSHADGSTGDISSSNIYLNFTPLQEREDWLMEWNRNGEFPYMAAELGQPYTGCYYKGNNFLVTEYLAMYFGEQAYRTEGLEGLQRTLEHSLNREPHEGALRPMLLAKRGVDLEQNYPLYWEFRRLFTWQTNRAWRMWGINLGMLYFNLQVAYGNPPDATHIWYRYRNLNSVMTAKPEWANAAFEIHKLGNQDFLGFIAGDPRHTDKTHLYYEGETVRKNAAFVYDGPGAADISFQWNAVEQSSSAPFARGKGNVKLNCGDIRMIPFEFKLPKLSSKKEFRIQMEFRQDGKTLFRDEFAFTGYPKPDFKTLPEFALFDPENTVSPLFATLGIPFKNVKKREELKTFKTLLIAPDALEKHDFPQTAEDVKQGLNVVVLEQTPSLWKSLALEPVDTMSRTVFLHRSGKSLLHGVSDTELNYWRGEPDAKETVGSIMTHDAQRGPRWTHTHAVAPLVLKIPDRAGFSPLLACEFDLNYSPLLRFHSGKGSMTFSTLAFRTRLGCDPGADAVFLALLKNVSASAQKADREMRAAGTLPPLLAKDLGLQISGSPQGMNPSESVLLVGKNSGMEFRRLAELAQKGCNVLILNDLDMLRQAGLRTVARECYRVAPANSGCASGAGLELLRFRDRLFADFILPTPGWYIALDGLIAEKEFGKGKIVFFQPDVYQYETRYASEPSRREATALTTEHLLRLTSVVLNSLEASGSPELLARLHYKQGTESFSKLNFFYVLGPFKVEREDGKAMLNTVFSGEASAISGDNNPNIVYNLPDGRKADWRRTVSADPSGFINLAKEFPKELFSVSYAVCYVKSGSDRTALLKFGCDWRAKIWCNGSPVFYTESGSPNYRFEVKVPLKKGENHITVKLGSGSAGNGFRMMLEQEKSIESVKRDIPSLNRVTLYRKTIPGFDPYVYYYW